MKKQQQMESLAIADLDIEELERRLELAAAAATNRGDWCSADVCGADCPKACVVLVA
ncbi:MAG TPA: hypothetical protein VIV40_30775 [Kofleriaceae bacterium]